VQKTIADRATELAEQMRQAGESEQISEMKAKINEYEA
jgi:hypothetical protein